MSTNIKLNNANGASSQLVISNPDTNFNGRAIDMSKVAHQVNTIADLRAMTEKPDTVYVTGYHTAGDGAFGSHFFKRVDSVGTDNSGTIIVPTGVATYYYALQYEGAVNVKWFGAVGDGVTDDSSAFLLLNTFLNSIATTDSWKDIYGLQITIAPGVYLVNDNITFSSFTHFYISGDQAKITGSGSITFTNMKTFKIENLFFYGFKINFTSLFRGVIENVHFEQCSTNTITFDNMINVIIFDCKFIYSIANLSNGSSIKFLNQSVENGSSIILDGLTNNLSFDSLYVEWCNHPITVNYSDNVNLFKGFTIENSYIGAQMMSGKNWGTTYSSGLITLNDTRTDKAIPLLSKVKLYNVSFMSTQILPSNSRTEALIKCDNSFMVELNNCSNYWSIGSTIGYVVTDIKFSGYGLDYAINKNVFLSSNIVVNGYENTSNLYKFINFRFNYNFNQFSSVSSLLNKGFIATNSTEDGDAAIYNNNINAGSKFISYFNTLDYVYDTENIEFIICAKSEQLDVTIEGIDSTGTSTTVYSNSFYSKYYYSLFKVNTNKIPNLLTTYKQIKITLNSVKATYYSYITSIVNNSATELSNKKRHSYEPALQNSWVNSSSRPLTVHISGNNVAISGNINSGDNSKDTIATVITEKPNYPIYKSLACSGGQVKASLETDGTLTILASDTHSGNAHSNTDIFFSFDM